MCLSVRVLEGDGLKPIMNTYFSTGAVGTRQQEFGNVYRNQRKGTFRAALLGQNALVLYSQWMSGQQMDVRNIIVPILKDDGQPNIEVTDRERTWRDSMSRRNARRYERRDATDIARLRTLATEL